MKIRSFVAARRLFNRAAIFFMLLLGGTATAYGVCDMRQPGDLEEQLTNVLTNKPVTCANWYANSDPSFYSWGAGGSMNLPVLTSALGLYLKGGKAYVVGGGVQNPTGYRIKYADWWIWYLASQVGEDPTVYLPPSGFSAPPARAKLNYFKGTEQFSNIYDTADVIAVVAVRYWAYLNRNNTTVIDSAKADQLILLTRKFLRANWAIYGMAAGETPVWTYDMGDGWRKDDNGNQLPARVPATPTQTTDTQFDPTAPRKGNGYIYDGHFLALAGARSKLGGHWNYDYRFPLFDRAIGELGNYVPLGRPPKEFALLNNLQSSWAAWAAGQSPTPDENAYGLTAEDRQNFDALLHNCYYTTNPRALKCPDPSQPYSSQDAQNFRSWLAGTYQPWLSSIKIATTYRILGARGWRASMMQENTNGNTTNFYAVYYQAHDPNDTAHAKATFLFPWFDKDGGIPGSSTYEPSTGLITAYHDKVQKRDKFGNLRTVHPECKVWTNIPTETPLIQLVFTPGNPPAFGSSAVAKSLAYVFTPGGTAFGNDVAWVSSNVPDGGVLQSANENWSWTEDAPLPHTEAVRVHLSSPVFGLHQHFFTGATDDLPVAAGDTLYTYVYLDPSNPPSEVMLQWFDGTWEHRAYWGANFIGWGADGQNSRRYMGDLPAAGDWARLEAPASLVGLEGHTINGMAFTLYNGQAAWDEAGKNSLAGPVTNVAVGGAATQSSTYLSYTDASHAIDGNSDGNFYDNSVTHTNADYQAWWQVDLGASYAIDSVNVWNRTDCCADRLSNFYILVSDQPFASTDLTSALSQPGVTGYYVGGQGGYPTTQAIQRSGRYVRVQLTGTNYLSLAEVEVFGRPVSSMPPPSPPTGLPSSDVVWIEDSIPAGATNVSGGWNWINSNPTPVSGVSAHQSASMSGGQQHFFYGTPNTLTINPGDKLFTYVYLDPANPPTEIMLQWYDAGAMPGYEWEHRAYWGANAITSLGTDGTDSRRYMGALPPLGQWVRLEAPASQVGLEGRTISGMAFAQWDGLVAWDRSGKNAQSFLAPPPTGDNVWIEDSLPAGATIYADNDSWTWNSINPTPVSGSLANQSSIYAGMHQHYFYSSGSTLQVNTGDKMVAYVYIDPQNPPSEIMLQWHDPFNDWNHRAYWGADQITNFGTRYNMGTLPAAGQWIRLEAPASLVGLEGATVNGMAFTLFGGRATWDHAGKRP